MVDLRENYFEYIRPKFANRVEGEYLVRQYRPGYFSGFENGVYRAKSFEDITNADWNKNFMHDDFKEFTISSYNGDEIIVEAHYESGAHWVVGFAIPVDSKQERHGKLYTETYWYTIGSVNL
jgi:hypothetical protein